MPLPLTILAGVIAPHLWPAFLLAVVLRCVAAYVVSAGVLRARLNWLLLPPEDLFEFVSWVARFFGDTVMWPKISAVR